jgi:hypothetical protein
MAIRVAHKGDSVVLASGVDALQVSRLALLVVAATLSAVAYQMRSS